MVKKKKIGSKIEVSKKELEYFTGFQCEHYSGKETCYDHPEQGGCCNSCWIRTWAERKLKKNYKGA